MGARITSESLVLRHDFTHDERLEMGQKLAEAHNRLAEIEEEKKRVVSQMKEREATVQATIGSLARNLTSGFSMDDVMCVLEYDSPHVGEVTYRRKDNGQYVKHRAMTETERQMDLPLAGDVIAIPPDKEAASIEASEQAIDNFFNPAAIVEAAATGEEPAQENADDLEEPEDPFTSPDPDAAKEAIKPENDAAFEAVAEKPAAKPKATRKPKGFDGPTNSSAIADF